jgi:cytochrome c-type biogenesis protein CcmH/NrfG
VNLVPGFAEGHLRLGEVLLKFDRSGEAVREFAEAARLDPQSAATQCQWGTALARDHKTAEAVSHFNEALRLKPDYPEARRALEQLQAAPAGPK